MHIVLFHDKSKKEITKEQADKLIEASCSNAQGANIGGSFYKFSAISKIMSQEDYYREYPEESPEQRNVFEELYGKSRDYTPLERTAEQDKNQFKGLLKGLKKFVDSELAKGRKPLHALKMYQEKLHNRRHKKQDQLFHQKYL